MKPKRLVTNAMLIAMYVVLSLVATINLGNMKFTLDSLPIIIGAALNTAAMYIDSKIYGYYSFACVFGGILPRIIAGIIIAFIFAAILPNILKPLKRIVISPKEARKTEEQN